MSTLSTRQRDLDFLEACKTKDCHVVRQFILSGCDPILIRNESGQNALHTASLHGNMDIVELLVKVYGCNPKITDHDGCTPLHLACRGGSIIVTDYLMKRCGYHSKDSSGNTLLHYACLSGDVPTVRYVIHVLLTGCYFYKLNVYRDDINVNAPYLYTNVPIAGNNRFIVLKNKNGETALHTACRAGHLSVLQCFVEELQLDQSLCDVLMSVSKQSCQYGRYDIFAYLVGSRCSPAKLTESSNDTPSPPPSAHSHHYRREHTLECMPVPSYRGVSGFRASTLKSSLKFACQNGKEEIVRNLIKEYECDPLVPDSDTGDTPLHSAAISGNVSLVSFLLGCQCDAMKCNKEGNTALHEACRWGYLEIVEKVLSAAPSTINASNQLMESPLHVACSRNRIQIGKVLVAIDNCDVMALNHLKETPLHVASCSSDYELIKCVLNRSKGALKCTDLYGDTPLFNACRVGSMNVVKLFVEAGCDPLHVNTMTHELPIHIACRTGNVELFKFLKNCMKSESWNQANIFEQTPLHLVCEKGNFVFVNDILGEISCDLNIKDIRGMTPLHIACKKSNIEIAKAILAQPTVDVNIEDEDGNTSLHLACDNENMDTVTLLMQYEPDVTIRNENGDTPVHIACRHQRFQILRKLLGTRKHGLKFGFNNEGVTPLHIASSSGHFEMVKYLVDGEHCDSNATSKQENCTPLHFACFEGHKDIATYLAERVPQTVTVCDVNGQCPVLLALQKKKYDVVKSLVPRYFDANSGVSKANLPLFLYSLDYGDADLLKYLVSDAKCNPTYVSPHGDTMVHFLVEFIDPLADIDSKHLYVLDVCSSQIDCVSKAGDTPLLHACNGAKNNAVTMLLKHNANPNCKDSRGNFPLHIACNFLNCDILRTLLSHKADSSCKDSRGDTPLHIACRCSKREVVEVLLEFKADTSSRDSDGETPLHIAVISSEMAYVKLLLDHKADMSAQDSHGDTPLHIASRSRKTSCVKMLLDYKADTSCKNSEGKTPIQVTTSYDITMMLIEYGANPQDVYTHYGEVLEKCKQEQPLHEMVKMLIVGNTLAGKTTLVEALKRESIHVTFVDNVTERTAGIVSTPFRSDKLGYVTFHDFAGQPEFYSSHSQFLLCNLSSDAIVLLLVNALDEDSELVKNFSYWMSFIKRHCSNMKCLPQIVVICSHLDELNNLKDVKESKLTQAMQKHQCLGPVFLDCRDPACAGMCQLKNLLGSMCDEVRSNIELDSQCHVLFTFMHTRFEYPVELCEVQRAIRKRGDISSRRTIIQKSGPDRDLFPSHLSNRSGDINKDSRDPGDLLPHTAHSLLNLLQTLNKKGHIILLKDEKQEEKSWIILKQDVFYETVHGTLFAPKNFEKNGPIRTNVGVVPLSTLVQVFNENTTDLKFITKYLVYKEFCHKIDDPETLQLISSESNTLMEGDDELYFFPCFIKVEKPSAVWKQRSGQLYCSGWCLQCSDEHFFQTNFLHVLLLRLTFKYAVKHKDVPSVSPFSRRCNLWKNGIYWSTTDGVEVLVELTHNFTFLLVLIRSLDTRQNVTMECVKLRASVIRTVFDVVEKTCPGLKPSESLIHCGLHDYPGCDLMSAEKISIKEAADSIKEGKAFSFSTNNELHNLEDVLFFEPYSGMGQDLLSALYEKNEEEMPSDYVLKLSQLFSTRKDKLECVLSISPVDIGDIHAHQVCQKNPELIPQRVIEHWKISTRKGSSSDLREAFDRYSVFSGRNPLTLCN